MESTPWNLDCRSTPLQVRGGLDCIATSDLYVDPLLLREGGVLRQSRGGYAIYVESSVTDLNKILPGILANFIRLAYVKKAKFYVAKSD